MRSEHISYHTAGPSSIDVKQKVEKREKEVRVKNYGYGYILEVHFLVQLVISLLVMIFIPVIYMGFTV